MKKLTRISIGGVLVLVGFIFFIVPGSILLVIAGLMFLSIDIPIAKTWLRKSQNVAQQGARRIDKWLVRRKH